MEIYMGTDTEMETDTISGMVWIPVYPVTQFWNLEILCNFADLCRIKNTFWKIVTFCVVPRAVYAPGDGQTSPAYSSQSVQCLYLNHLLPVNKLVLLYPKKLNT